jgi:hypothetical protein
MKEEEEEKKKKKKRKKKKKKEEEEEEEEENQNNFFELDRLRPIPKSSIQSARSRPRDKSLGLYLYFEF